MMDGTHRYMTRDTVDMDSVLAVADVVARSGGSEFEIGYEDDNPDDPRWYAQAVWPAGKLGVYGKDGPDEAADGLARRVLAGGRCTNCHKIVSLSMANPTRCRWYRNGASWIRGCDGKAHATKVDA